MAEHFGVEGRGNLYEEVGAVCDVVQNHLLQVVAHLAMEPPVGADGDAMGGDSTLFARQDSVEQAWRIVAPILILSKPVVSFEPGSWGPDEAAPMTAAIGGWHAPSDLVTAR